MSTTDAVTRNNRNLPTEINLKAFKRIKNKKSNYCSNIVHFFIIRMNFWLYNI